MSVPSRPTPPEDLRRTRQQALLAMALVAGFLLLEVLAIGSKSLPAPTVDRRLGPARNRAEKLIWGMDGKAFFELALDPTLKHETAAYGGDADHAAYRASRPLMGWVGTATSLGQRPVLGWAMLAITVASAGALVLALGAVARAIGRPGDHLVVALAAPGMLAAVVYPGVSEPLAVALVLFGLARWLEERPWHAAALFAAAALTRETMLLVPLALALHHLWTTRRLRGVWPLAVPVGVYLGWMVVVRAAIGVVPSRGGDQMSAPFVGMVQAMPGWTPMEWFTVAATFGLGAVAWIWGTAAIRWVVAVHLLFLTCLSDIVFGGWWAFGRIALPVAVLGVACLPLQRQRSAASDAAAAHGALEPAPPVGAVVSGF